MKRDQRHRNRYLGGIVPFGFRAGEDGALVPDEAERAIIARARALRAAGATIRAIQAALEAEHGRSSLMRCTAYLQADVTHLNVMRATRARPLHPTIGGCIKRRVGTALRRLVRAYNGRWASRGGSSEAAPPVRPTPQVSDWCKTSSPGRRARSS